MKFELNLGLFGFISIVLSVLKLCGVIAWSWWWVLLPLYGAFGIAVIFYIVIIGVLTNIFGNFGKTKTTQKKRRF